MAGDSRFTLGETCGVVVRIMREWFTLPSPSAMSIIGLNFLYAVGGVVLMWLSYRIFDRLMPQVDFAEELKRGNVAVSIFIGALFISIAMIIGGALN
jgi:uncharacterized membrane protein YjfL (UPF0719 family)